jgi:hypothetical protein
VPCAGDACEVLVSVVRWYLGMPGIVSWMLGIVSRVPWYCLMVLVLLVRCQVLLVS